MNVEQGDLVVLVYAKNEENLGALGQVISFVGNHTYALTGATINDGWEVRYYQPLRIAGIDRRTGQHFLGEEQVYITPDRYLRPLRGGDVRSEETTKEELPLMAETV